MSLHRYLDMTFLCIDYKIRHAKLHRVVFVILLPVYKLYIHNIGTVLKYLYIYTIIIVYNIIYLYICFDQFMNIIKYYI